VRPCNGCRQSKPAEAFYRRPNGTPYGPCKSCRRSAASARYHARSAALAELEHLRTIVAAVQAQLLSPGGDLA
jgi:hypothetical protein